MQLMLFKLPQLPLQLGELLQAAWKFPAFLQTSGPQSAALLVPQHVQYSSSAEMHAAFMPGQVGMQAQVCTMPEPLHKVASP